MTEQSLKRRMRSDGINIESKRKAFRTFALSPLALGVAALTGCGQTTEGLSIQVYKDLEACKQDPKNTITSSCEATYEKALREAARTSEKFSSRGMCETEYGVCEALPQNIGYRPKMAAFMMAEVKPEHHREYNISSQYGDVFYQPLFTSDSKYSELYGSLFFADGKVIGKYSGFDNIQFEMSQRYLHPLTTVRLPTQEEVARMAAGGASEATGKADVSALDTLATAYIASEVIDELGDYSERKHKERMYQERLKREKEQQSGVSYTSGTGVGKYTDFNNTIKEPSTMYSSGKASTSKTYDSKPVVTTKSKGGFGGTGSAKSSWGG